MKMDRQIILSKRFQNKMKKIYKQNYYLQKDFSDKVFGKIENLKIFPFMYPIISQKRRIRKVFIQNYIVLYRIESEYIKIINIIPQKSNYSNKILGQI